MQGTDYRDVPGAPLSPFDRPETQSLGIWSGFLSPSKPYAIVVSVSYLTLRNQNQSRNPTATMRQENFKVFFNLDFCILYVRTNLVKNSLDVSIIRGGGVTQPSWLTRRRAFFPSRRQSLDPLP